MRHEGSWQSEYHVGTKSYVLMGIDERKSQQLNTQSINNLNNKLIK